jgi:hypothetical protein
VHMHENATAPSFIMHIGAWHPTKMALELDSPLVRSFVSTESLCTVVSTVEVQLQSPIHSTTQIPPLGFIQV